MRNTRAKKFRSASMCYKTCCTTETSTSRQSNESYTASRPGYVCKILNCRRANIKNVSRARVWRPKLLRKQESKNAWPKCTQNTVEKQTIYRFSTVFWIELKEQLCPEAVWRPAKFWNGVHMWISWELRWRIYRKSCSPFVLRTRITRKW